MEFSILRHVVDELAGILPGSRLERIFQAEDGGIYVLLHRQRETTILLLSPDRLVPKIHFVMSKPAAVHSPAAFVLFLRSNIKGARVTAISLLNDDRIVDISLSRGGSAFHLIFEVFSNTPNLMLTDHQFKILSLMHAGMPVDNRKRVLLPGLHYEPPLKKESRERAAFDFKPDCTSRWPVNRGAERYYEKQQTEREIIDVRSRIAMVVKRALEKTERRIAAITRDLEGVHHAEDYRKYGELILSRGRHLTSGTEWADLADYDGRNIRVRLDPRYSSVRNAELYFKKYKKAKKGASIINARLEQARNEEAELRILLNRSHSIEDTTVLRDIWSGLSSHYTGRGPAVPGRGKTAKPSVPGYRNFHVGGWDILVGKSAEGNDYITFRVAGANDLWLHAEGMPGSHVVVRNPKSAEIPPDVLRKAAGLAAYFSKGRRAGKVPVTYASVKFVRKPKGVPRGTVTLSQRKTIMVKPEAS